VRKGFTLIEVMISASLMGLVLGASYMCLSSGLSTQRIVEGRVDAIQTARAALDMISADLRAACPLSQDYDFLGMDRMLEDVEADNLDFGTHNYRPARAREGDFCEVSYYLRKDPDSRFYSIWRRRDASPDDKPLAGGKQQQIARAVQGLRFEYYDGFDWFDEWGDPLGKKRGKQSLLDPPNISGYPEAVRITIWVDPNPEKKEPQENAEPALMFQTTVRLNLAAVSTRRSSSGSTPASNENANPGNPQPGAPGGPQ
jgi:type II secretion system protein J